jgi:hypothetical protein
MPKRMPISVQVVEEAAGRFVITTFPDGEIVRTLVDPNKKPARRPRRPFTKVKTVDFTRKKRF